jgi:hypothetical protein
MVSCTYNLPCSPCVSSIKVTVAIETRTIERSHRHTKDFSFDDRVWRLPQLNKSILVKQIIARLAENLGLLQKAAQAAHAEATHESSKAENKYDTRGLEAAYLAGGQARQAKEIQDAIGMYESLAVRQFSTAEPIALTAVVEVETDGALSTYFIGPKAGGLEIEHAGREILVITPQSPLGKSLMGRKSGERWVADLNGSKVKSHIISVG